MSSNSDWLPLLRAKARRRRRRRSKESFQERGSFIITTVDHLPISATPTFSYPFPFATLRSAFRTEKDRKGIRLSPPMHLSFVSNALLRVSYPFFKAAFFKVSYPFKRPFLGVSYPLVAMPCSGAPILFNALLNRLLSFSHAFSLCGIS